MSVSQQTSAADARTRFLTPALILACGVVVAWCGVLIALKPDAIADERLHQPVIAGVAEGRWPPARALVMPPTYHALLGAASWLFGPSLAASRAMTALLAVATLLLIRATERRLWPGEPDGQRALLAALNPLLLTYFALVYTETAALLLLALACYFQARRSGWAAAAALTLACLVRQSHLVWFGLLAVWALEQRIRPDGEGSASSATDGRRANWFVRGRAWLIANQQALAPPLCGVLGVLMLYDLIGGMERGGSGLNKPRPNVAQIHIFGLSMGLLLLPIWMAGLSRDGRRRLMPGLRRPLGIGACLLAVGILCQVFQSSHPFNNETDYLHNHVLRAMQRDGGVRALVCALLAPVALGLWLDWRRQPRRRLLAWVWLFSAAYLALHWPVDPRYYIPVVLLLLLLGRPTPRVRGWMHVCNAAGVLAMAAYVLARGGPGGGVW